MNKRTCIIENCDRTHYARDMCKMHYQRRRTEGALDLLPPVSLASRLVSGIVEDSNGCLEWTRATDSKGYGQIRSGGRSGRLVATHRLAWELAHGPIPVGLHVLHTCDNPPCCNIDHLFVGTPAVNMQDRRDKGRHFNQTKTHCIRGHEFTPENTYVYRGRKGRLCRCCRACKRTAAKPRSQFQ